MTYRTIVLERESIDRGGCEATHLWLAVLALAAMAAALTSTTALAANAERRATDTAVAAAVTDELLYDPAVPLNRIDVDVRQGVVTLKGEVDNVLAKDRAARIAETVKGVRAVINRIEVEPSTQRSDEAIESDIENALVTDPAAESFEVSVAVQDGTAVLSGTVESFQERHLAAQVAKGVRGVEKIGNQIDVDYKTDRGDGDIEADIQRALHWDTLVDDALIEVDVNNGKVTLTGTVGSAAEKTQAAAEAWVAGVKEVDASGLKVAKWARDEDLRKDKYEPRSDEAIRDAVTDAFVYDPRLVPFEITPEVRHGVVTLRGTVSNLKAKRAAAEVARRTVGVVRVKNRLKVRPGGDISDTEIVENLREALRRDPFIEGFEVTVSVVDGVAHLYGSVDSYFEKGRADDVASRTKGVVAVRNNLDVAGEGQPLTYEPFLEEDIYPYDYDWYDYEPSPTYTRDSEIETDIEDELWWSPFVDKDQVTVSVENGVAHLTGEVDDWSEREAATQNAYEGGATWVDNDLTVK
ncbi:MAG: BON domain-containing protein [Phycisphaerae bacterium]